MKRDDVIRKAYPVPAHLKAIAGAVAADLLNGPGWILLPGGNVEEVTDDCDGPHGGLCVTKPGKRGGVLLTGAQGADYRDAIATALDDGERAALCRAALQP